MPYRESGAMEPRAKNWRTEWREWLGLFCGGAAVGGFVVLALLVGTFVAAAGNAKMNQHEAEQERDEARAELNAACISGSFLMGGWGYQHVPCPHGRIDVVGDVATCHCDTPPARDGGAP